MNIVVVGNVLKDVYLNLDTRGGDFEQDKTGTQWLDVSFDASEHRFFSRHSCLGGAAISYEVLTKLGAECSVAGTKIQMSADGLDYDSPVGTYRYILVANGKTSYFAPSKFESTDFIAPVGPVDYLYVDRSAELTQEASANIATYLDTARNVRLILYAKSLNNSWLNKLLPRASLIFLENNRGRSELPHALVSAGIDDTRVVWLSEKELNYRGAIEKLSLDRIDVTTHLSMYSVAAATIFGGFALGCTVAETLALARANIEHSKLDTSLDLQSLKELALESSRPSDLELIAASLMLPGKGILAADESGGSIKKKFASMDIPDTYDTRRDYRNIFFAAPDIEKYLNGIILFEETAHQYADNGQNFVEYLAAKRIIPGIKVDKGLKKIDKSLETYTDGLNGLTDRLNAYYVEGLRFAKWRAAFEIRLSEAGEMITPTERAIEKNCADLAEYAKQCQDARIVPIVEPEVVYSGHHSIDDCAKATGRVLDDLFRQLKSAGVNLRACILKVNMVLAGKDFPKQSTAEEVGVATAKVLREHVPEDLAGVVFLSGGQTPEQATENLAAIMQQGPFPWPVTFSFARALQDPALYAWGGDNKKTSQAQEAFVTRLVANAKALSTQ